MSDETIDYILREAISRSQTRAGFVDSAHGELVQRKHESLFRRAEAGSRHWRFVKDLAGREDEAPFTAVERAILAAIKRGDYPPPTTAEATTVADQTQYLTDLGREVSGLAAKVNILLGLAGTVLVAVVAGAIALWQAIGGVETRLTVSLARSRLALPNRFPMYVARLEKSGAG